MIGRIAYPVSTLGLRPLIPYHMLVTSGTYLFLNLPVPLPRPYFPKSLAPNGGTMSGIPGGGGGPGVFGGRGFQKSRFVSVVVGTIKSGVVVVSCFRLVVKLKSGTSACLFSDISAVPFLLSCASPLFLVVVGANMLFGMRNGLFLP